MHIACIPNYQLTQHPYVLLGQNSGLPRNPKVLLKMIQHLVDSGAIIDEEDVNGNTPVDIAIKCHFYQVEGYFWKISQNLFPKGYVPISILAVYKNDFNLIKKLISASYPIDLLDPTGKSALMMASRWGNFEIVKLLVKNGAEVNQKDFGGYSAIEEAKIGGHEVIVEFLKESGAIFDSKRLNDLRRYSPNYSNFIFVLFILLFLAIGFLF